MKAITRLLWLFALVFSTSFTWAQIFPQQSGSGPAPATNILSSIPRAGILRIDYNFYTIPDRLDVYYGNTDIFSSGLLQNSGEFNIPYGPGDLTSLMVVVNQGGGDFNTVWDYIPSVVPAPEPGSVALAGLGLSTMAFLSLRRRTG